LIHCHHGGRSGNATEFLLRNGYTDVTNVAGGIDAWSQEIDSSIRRY
jgi:rhodanese-related sulfurtransferase